MTATKITLQLSGYSVTPLAKVLGIKVGFTIKLINAPYNYFALFTDLPQPIHIVNDSNGKKDFIHFFTKSEEEYLKVIPVLKN